MSLALILAGKFIYPVAASPKFTFFWDSMEDILPGIFQESSARLGFLRPPTAWTNYGVPLFPVWGSHCWTSWATSWAPV